MKVLVIAAHADDETLGAGATVASHIAKGDEVSVAIATDCRTMRDPGAKPTLSEEAVKALSVLGVKNFLFFGLPAMTLAFSEQELNSLVEATVAEIKPDIIYTHHWADVNSDHRAINSSVMVAARPTGKPQKVLCFEVPSSTEWAWGESFRPNYFVQHTVERVNKKLSAMAKYESELRPYPHPRNLDALRVRAEYWGQVAGSSFAEAFVLAREITP